MLRARTNHLAQLAGLLVVMLAQLAARSAPGQVRINTDDPDAEPVVPTLPQRSGQEPLTAQIATRLFELARERTEADNGELWGVDLWGPLLIADPSDRSVAANVRDKTRQLSRDDAVFTGTLPAGVNIFNTLAYWADDVWAMVTWPMPADDSAAAALMLHELFHRVQPQLGLPQRSPACLHLDAMSGRLYLRLELRALAEAMTTRDAAREQAMRDALLFRAMRRSLFDGEAAKQEAVLELNEGLAEYTGRVLSGAMPAKMAAAARDFIRAKEHDVSLMRSFSYATGLAYALLLDANSGGWRKLVDERSDLGSMLAQAVSFRTPENLAQAALQAAERYEMIALTAEETAREQQRQRAREQWRARLVDGPTLEVSFQSDSKFVYNQHTMSSLDGFQHVRNARIADTWGVLTVTDGALVIEDPPKPKAIRVSGAGLTRENTRDARSVEGDGWRLDLADGWRLVPGRKRDTWIVRKRR